MAELGGRESTIAPPGCIEEKKKLKMGGQGSDSETNSQDRNRRGPSRKKDY